MASIRSETDKAKTVTLADFAQDVLRRRSVLGQELAIPRNSGTRRTQSKKMLLKAVADAGGKW